MFYFILLFLLHFYFMLSDVCLQRCSLCFLNWPSGMNKVFDCLLDLFISLRSHLSLLYWGVERQFAALNTAAVGIQCPWPADWNVNMSHTGKCLRLSFIPIHTNTFNVNLFPALVQLKCPQFTSQALWGSDFSVWDFLDLAALLQRQNT